ncbi:MAG: pantoate--beta-alanine ligase [Ginsengibacter sp.]
MILFKKAGDLNIHLQKLRSQNLKIGFVPTMGALHGGHVSLIERSKSEIDITVCSIYVNPLQFNNKKDFETYPLKPEADILLLEHTGCDILFHPTENQIYPDQDPMRSFDLGRLEQIFEGKFRPGHFQGVCLIVEKLLGLVKPNQLYLGQKDYQQTLVIKKLVQLMGMDIGVTVCPTFREESGLAMSSRNLRLNVAERELASELYKSLMKISKELFSRDIEALKDEAIARLESIGFKVEYLEIATTDGLQAVQKIEPKYSYIILIAAFLGSVRLIDNLMVTG